MNRSIAPLGAILLLFGLLVTPVAAAGTGTAATDIDADEPTVHVELTADGDATVSLVSLYDLDDEDERDAFATLEADDEARAELLDRYADRMAAVAENANDDTDRGMSVAADSVDVRTADDRGIVVLSVTWENIAAVEGDRLVVTEPFASGYEADRAVVLVGPDGSTFDAAAPEPDDETDRQARWNAGTAFDGFEATFALSSDANTGAESDDAGDDSVPGFGVAVTSAALLALLGTALRRNR